MKNNLRNIICFVSIFHVPSSLYHVIAQSFPDEMHMSTDGRMLLLGDLPNTGLYDQSLIRNVYLTFSQPDYWAQLENNYWGWQKAEIPATMVVDGITYDSVGVRFKGQSSFQQIQTSKKNLSVFRLIMPTPIRISWGVNL